uniref:Uncharacterized protein n=1 Tax=Solanum tuberosum TaxID=4113 RepID=M1B5A0_SOLTU
MGWGGMILESSTLNQKSRVRTPVHGKNLVLGVATPKYGCTNPNLIRLQYGYRTNVSHKLLPNQLFMPI